MKSFSRRKFMVRGGAAAAAMTIASSLSGSLRADPLAHPPGIQLYTVAAPLRADVPGTLSALHAIGYRVVESAGFVDLSAKDFHKALDEAGLRCPSAHLQFGTADPGPLFDDANAVGVHAISSLLLPPGVRNTDNNSVLTSITLDDFKRTAELANTIGAKAKQAGLQYAYHNHNYEFRDQGNGQTGYDLLLKETDPSLVKFELDCGWMVAAGRNPVDYFRRFPDRYRLLHIKDFVAGSKVTTDLMGPNRPVGIELGRGYIDYKPIFAAAQAAGVDYYFSEQEPPIVGKTALEAAKINYDYMHAL
jgi:sugar phosphate isomerase/epimerase